MTGRVMGLLCCCFAAARQGGHRGRAGCERRLLKMIKGVPSKSIFDRIVSSSWKGRETKDKTGWVKHKKGAWQGARPLYKPIYIHLLSFYFHLYRKDIQPWVRFGGVRNEGVPSAAVVLDDALDCIGRAMSMGGRK